MSKNLWEMPAVEPGERVVWLNHYTQPVAEALSRGQVGIVAGCGTQSVDLALLVPGSATFLPKNGVRHRSDPRKSIMDNNPDDGAWEHLPSRQAPVSQECHDELGARVERLEETVRSLNGRVTALHRGKTAKTSETTEEAAAPPA